MGYSAGSARLWGVAAFTVLIFLCPAARADIWQWTASPTYGTGDDHAAWYLQSTTLCAGGAGVNAVPKASLSDKNLTQAYLVGADLSGADLHAANLTNATMVNANLSNANFPAATLTGADFTGATIKGAYLDSMTSKGFTKEQLYSTASYTSGDLSGIHMDYGNLSGWSFAGKNLHYAGFQGASLANADLSGASLTGAQLERADLRGAQSFSSVGVFSTTNMIWPDGKVNGLRLMGHEWFIIRNHDSIPVNFQNSASIGSGILQFVFDGNAWHKPVTFGPGVTPEFYHGALDVQWSPDPGFQLAEGQRMELALFQWGNVQTGARRFFQTYLSGAPKNVILDSSRLSTDGSVELVACYAGDSNGDGRVDVGDLGILGANYGSPFGPGWRQADFTGDGKVDVSDLAVLGANYGFVAPVGSVPEPAMLSVLLLGSLRLLKRRAGR